MPVFLSTEPSSSLSQREVNIKQFIQRSYYADMQIYLSGLCLLLTSYIITSRHPTLSEHHGRELPVIHLQPQFASWPGSITTVLIIWLQAVPWLNQLQRGCRHIGVTPANPVSCEDLQFPDHSSSPVLLACSNLKRMTNTTSKVTICSSPLWKGQKSRAPVRDRLETALRQVIWGQY